jgi:broad-specificity NMP kinase
MARSLKVGVRSGARSRNAAMSAVEPGSRGSRPAISLWTSSAREICSARSGRWVPYVGSALLSSLRHNGGVPFACEGCGRRSVFPDLIPAVGDVLRCPHCAHEWPFVRPPLLVVTGTAGIGKFTLCAELAGTVPDAVLLDADVLAVDLVSVAPPNQDYPAFWQSMMRLAHELAQNNVVVVYFSTLLPEQVLANSDVLDYFDSVHFLCLTCPPDVLWTRLAGRDGSAVAPARLNVLSDFNTALLAAASETPEATVVDAGRTTDEVEHDVRHWINTHLHGCDAIGTDSTP